MKANTTSQKARPDRTGMVTRLAMTPSTASTTVTQNVMFFGALSFMVPPPVEEYMEMGRLAFTAPWPCGQSSKAFCSAALGAILA
jgi:hypothetical protein